MSKITHKTRRMCEDCRRATAGPGWRLYDPACLWCGARLIQSIQNLKGRVSPVRIEQRVKHVLLGWTHYGHNSQELLAMANEPNLPLQPWPPQTGTGATGQVASGARGDRTPTKLL